MNLPVEHAKIIYQEYVGKEKASYATLLHSNALLLDTIGASQAQVICMIASLLVAMERMSQKNHLPLTSSYYLELVRLMVGQMRHATNLPINMDAIGVTSKN